MREFYLSLVWALVFGTTALFADTPRIVAAEFTPTPAPATEQQFIEPYTQSSLRLRFAAGEQAQYPLQYRTLFRSGDRIGDHRIGLIVDREGKPLSRTGPLDNTGITGLGPFFANGPDGNSLIRLPDAAPGELHLVTHFEFQEESLSGNPPGKVVGLYGKLPMVMNLAVLQQNSSNGLLTPTSAANISMATVNGLWTPCGSSLTPWNSHLGSEEYEPNAAYYADRALEPMNLYLGTPGKTPADGGARPYDYGFPVEVSINADATTKVTKHYAMGRLSLEVAEVMPDRRTVYMGDDGADVTRMMFVADRAEDFSAGTLFAARWEQTNATLGGSAELTWLRLGHGEAHSIRALIDSGIRFDEIFSVLDPDESGDYHANPSHYPDFRPVFVFAGSNGRARLQFLKPNAEQLLAAAFLETRRYAAWRGATTEFVKMEGQTHDAASRRLFTAISTVGPGMLAGHNGKRPNDHIQLTGDPQDLKCGVVYASDLRADVRDAAGQLIDSAWVAINMRAVVTGRNKPDTQQSYGKFDLCDTDLMANPDNLKYSPALRTLFISEDSSFHLNNFLWAANLESGQIVRIMSAPVGAELTGLQIAEDYNGFGYVMSNIQHPGARFELFKSHRQMIGFSQYRYPPEVREVLGGRVDKRGIVGYLAGLPALHR